MIYDKSDFAINIQRVWNRPVTAHLRNDPAAWDARPQLGLQHRPPPGRGSPPAGWCTACGPVHAGACPYRYYRLPPRGAQAIDMVITGAEFGGMTDEEALAGIDDLGVIAQARCWTTSPCLATAPRTSRRSRSPTCTPTTSGRPDIPPPGSDRPAFTNVDYLVAEPEWTQRHYPEAQGMGDMIKALAPRVRTVAEGEEIFPGTHVRFTPGHSAGHAAYVINAGGQRVIAFGDAFHSPLQITHPPWENLRLRPPAVHQPAHQPPHGARQARHDRIQHPLRRRALRLRPHRRHAGLGPGRRLRTAQRGTFHRAAAPGRRPRRLRTVHDAQSPTSPSGTTFSDKTFVRTTGLFLLLLLLSTVLAFSIR